MTLLMFLLMLMFMRYNLSICKIVSLIESALNNLETHKGPCCLLPQGLSWLSTGLESFGDIVDECSIGNFSMERRI